MGSSASASAALSGSTWTQGLVNGPNGPIPRIVVDQFGYRPDARKVALFRNAVDGYDAGATYRPSAQIDLVDARSGESVVTGEATAWHEGAKDPISGDQIWSFDFSSVRRAGEYFVQDRELGVRSGVFRIGPDVYVEVMRTALRTFFRQRAGARKPAAMAGDAWQDEASHLGPGQDSQARSWLAKGSAGGQRDLRGGWYDAGDYNKYTSWHAGYLIALLDVAVEHPDIVGDDLGIPESGNGVSDLLDEIAWGLEWLVRMQEPDGSVLCIQGLAPGSPPSAARGPSYYGPATTNATLRAAAAMAYAASVFERSGVPRLVGWATELTRRASEAWNWAQEHPSVAYFNNDDARQPGSGGLGGGQQEVDDAGRDRSRFEAAVYMYGSTGRTDLRAYAESQYSSQLPSAGQEQWTVDIQGVLLHLAGLPGVSERVREDIHAHYQSVLERASDAVASETDPYRAPIGEYTWGSNRSKAAMGRLFALANAEMAEMYVSSAVSAGARDAAEGYLHYLHGVNPLGLVYLTNMAGQQAEHSASTLYHTWYAQGTRWDAVTESQPGPAPGFLVGGPNPAYSTDACCAQNPRCAGGADGANCGMALSPPLGQPAMKSYLQFNHGWPVNSWEVTENSNGYQVQYLRLLAEFAG